jgi:hypothetical protein
MEQTREQQLQPPSAPPHPALAHEPPPSLYPAPDRLAPSPLLVAARLTRLIGLRLLRALLRLWDAAQPRLGWLALTAFLLCVIGVLGALLALPRVMRGAPPADTRTALIPPAQAVTDFLRGQQTYDADLMWDSFSPSLRSSLEQREITRATLAEQVEIERRAGQRYRKVEYIGAVPVDGRETMYFFAVEIQSPAPERSGTFSVVFTVDEDGKISSVKL